MNGEVQGTRDPTGHMLLMDLHFELPFGKIFNFSLEIFFTLSLFKDVENEQVPNKTGYNVDYMNQEQYIENCNDYGDYQSDYNYQNQTSYGNNYGQLATPRSSLETSRQNSYERDERQYYDVNQFYNGQYQESPPYDNADVNEVDYDDEALYYNSRPMK